jgi:hypothetical protein
MNAGFPETEPRKCAAGAAWRVFLTAWIVYSFFWTPYLVREHLPAVALIERGSLNVERYVGWTGDVFRSPTGGVYINNNPGASLTAAIALLPLRPLLIRVDRWNQALPRPVSVTDNGELFWRTVREGRAYYFLLVEFLTVAFVMAPVTAAAAAYLCSRLIEAGVPPRYSTATALLYALGTPVFFRAAHLNHNLLVADAGLIALLLVWHPHGGQLSVLRAVAAGLLAGYAILCDYSGVVVAGTMAAYVWLRSDGLATTRRWRLLMVYAAGAVPGVFLLVIYQSWAFGSPYLPSQHYMAPTAPTALGYRGFDWPSPALVWANFFDPRFGLFAYCPALLLAAIAPFARRVRYRMPDREMWVLLGYFALFVVFCAANQYSWLQPSTGFRYLAPVVPALTLLAVQAAQLLPPPLRWGIAIITCAESLLLAASHSNDVRLVFGTLRGRDGELLWMRRLRDAGIPFTSGWICLSWAALIAVCALIWFLPARLSDEAG